MNKILRVVFVACVLACTIASADQADDILRLASSKRADERVIAALGLPDIIRLRGVAAVSSYYKQLLSDSDGSVVAETLMAIKRTPGVVSVRGTREKTLSLLIKLRPRVEELCMSSNKTTAQVAREARDSIRRIEREDK